MLCLSQRQQVSKCQLTVTHTNAPNASIQQKRIRLLPLTEANRTFAIIATVSNVKHSRVHAH